MNLSGLRELLAEHRQRRITTADALERLIELLVDEQRGVTVVALVGGGGATTDQVVRGGRAE
jgi:hypothetical protein